MKFSSLLFSIVVVIAGVPPVIGAPEPSRVEIQRISAESPARASRSADRTPELVVVAAPATTTTTTSTTAPPPPPPTTARPATTTSTTAKPRRPATTTTTSPPAVETSGGGRDDIVQMARAQLGKSYRSGATGPNAFDCSGLVYYVFNHAGVSLPRLTSDGYLAAAKRISRSELQPGDVVVGRGHIGIYVGGGQMVHASTPRGGVKQSPIDAPGTPIGYGRL